MPDSQKPLNRLEVMYALKTSNWEAVCATIHITLTQGAFLTGFALALGASNVWLGVLGSIPAFSGIVQVFSSVYVEQTRKRKWFTALSSFAGRIAWLPILLIPFVLPSEFQFTAFAVLFLFSSVCLSAPVPAFTSWMADLVPPDKRGRYFGFRNMLAGVTTMAVSLPCAWFLDLAAKRHKFSVELAFAILFSIACVFAVASFVLLAKQHEPPMAPALDDRRNFRWYVDLYAKPFKDVNFRRFLLFAGVFGAGQFFAAPFYTAYALKVLKLDYVVIQAFATVTSITSLVSMPIWGMLADKFGNRPILVVSGLGVCVLPVCWAFTSPTQHVLTWTMLAAVHVLGGLFWAGVGLSQFNLLIGISPNEQKSIFVGTMSAVAGVAGGISPIVGGALLAALADRTWQIGALLFGGYHIVFFTNAFIRLCATAFLTRVADPASESARSMLTDLGQAKVGGWMQVRRVQSAQTDVDRRDALHGLRGIRSRLAVDELVMALDDPSFSVREEAAEALGEIADPRAVSALIAKLDDPVAGVTRLCAEALGRIRDKTAVPALTRVLREGGLADRGVAARALGRIGGPDVIVTLRSVLSDASMPDEVQEVAAIALGTLHDSESTPLLLEAAESGERGTRIAAIRALGDIADPSVGNNLANIVLNETDEAIITHAAMSHAMAGAANTAHVLVEALERVNSQLAKRQLCHALAVVLADGDAYYRLLTSDPDQRDAFIIGTLDQLGKESSGDTSFSELREKVEMETALEEYATGETYRMIQRVVKRRATLEGDPAYDAAHALLHMSSEEPSEEVVVLVLHLIATAATRAE